VVEMNLNERERSGCLDEFIVHHWAVQARNDEELTASSLCECGEACLGAICPISVGLSIVAAFSNVGKALHLGDARIWLKGTNGAIFSGALSPMALRWRFRGGSADTGRAPRAHRSRAKVERGIWVLFHVEIWRLMVADELADHQARPSPAVLRPVGSGLWAPDMLNRGPAASTADLGLRESGQRKDS